MAIAAGLRFKHALNSSLSFTPHVPRMALILEIVVDTRIMWNLHAGSPVSQAWSGQAISWFLPRWPLLRFSDPHPPSFYLTDSQMNHARHSSEACLTRMDWNSLLKFMWKKIPRSWLPMQNSTINFGRESLYALVDWFFTLVHCKLQTVLFPTGIARYPTLFRTLWPGVVIPPIIMEGHFLALFQFSAKMAKLNPGSFKFPQKWKGSPPGSRNVGEKTFRFLSPALMVIQKYSRI